jgi:hypothetical protein
MRLVSWAKLSKVGRFAPKNSCAARLHGSDPKKLLLENKSLLSLVSKRVRTYKNLDSSNEITFSILWYKFMLELTCAK